MSAVSHQLPLPVGARFSAPTRRARADIWAAPDPSALVLDPWSPPAGRPVVLSGVATWAPPVASARVIWMPAPASLLPPPAPFAAPDPTEAVASTDRAIETLRSLAEAPPVPAFAPIDPPGDAGPVVLSFDQPMPRSLHDIGTIDAPRALPAPDPADLVVGVDDPLADGPAQVAPRWKLLAIVTGVGAAAAATITLLASLL